MRLILEVKEISQRDVTTIAELRAETEEERVAASNRVFRVLYNMNSIKIGAEQHDQ